MPSEKYQSAPTTTVRGQKGENKMRTMKGENKMELTKDEKFYVLVAGSRTFADYELMKSKLNKLLINHNDIVVVSGGARGADALAERYAKEKGYSSVVIEAQWNVLGKRAGFVRNERMHQLLAKHTNRGCVCFWDGESKGTAHNFELAKKYNTPLRVIKF